MTREEIAKELWGMVGRDYTWHDVALLDPRLAADFLLAADWIIDREGAARAAAAQTNRAPMSDEIRDDCPREATCEHPRVGHNDGPCCAVCEMAEEIARLRAENEQRNAQFAGDQVVIARLREQVWMLRDAIDNEFPADVGTGYRAHTPKAISSVMAATAPEEK